jgi:hypothetical protein
MFSKSILTLTLVSTALAWTTGLTLRDTTQAPIVACTTNPAASGCDCPTDLNGDDGVLINVYPVRRCAPSSPRSLTRAACAGLPVRVPRRRVHVGGQHRQAPEHAPDELPGRRAVPRERVRVPGRQQPRHGRAHQRV